MAPVDDAAIAQAIGLELRTARRALGCSRPQFVRRLDTDMPVNTYACYEQGIRPCPLPRLVEFCQVLGVSTSELISRALERVGVPDERPTRVVGVIVVEGSRITLLPPNDKSLALDRT